MSHGCCTLMPWCLSGHSCVDIAVDKVAASPQTGELVSTDSGVSRGANRTFQRHCDLRRRGPFKKFHGGGRPPRDHEIGCRKGIARLEERLERSYFIGRRDVSRSPRTARPTSLPALRRWTTFRPWRRCWSPDSERQRVACASICRPHSGDASVLPILLEIAKDARACS